MKGEVTQFDLRHRQVAAGVCGADPSSWLLHVRSPPSGTLLSVYCSVSAVIVIVNSGSGVILIKFTLFSLLAVGKENKVLINAALVIASSSSTMSIFLFFSCSPQKRMNCNTMRSINNLIT